MLSVVDQYLAHLSAIRAAEKVKNDIEVATINQSTSQLKLDSMQHIDTPRPKCPVPNDPAIDVANAVNAFDQLEEYNRLWRLAEDPIDKDAQSVVECEHDAIYQLNHMRAVEARAVRSKTALRIHLPAYIGAAEPNSAPVRMQRHSLSYVSRHDRQSEVVDVVAVMPTAAVDVALNPSPVINCQSETTYQIFHQHHHSQSSVDLASTRWTPASISHNSVGIEAVTSEESESDWSSKASSSHSFSFRPALKESKSVHSAYDNLSEFAQDDAASILVRAKQRHSNGRKLKPFQAFWGKLKTRLRSIGSPRSH